MTEEHENTRQVMSVRLPRDLHEWLRRAAFDSRRPMGTIVIQALYELQARTAPPLDQV